MNYKDLKLYFRLIIISLIYFPIDYFCYFTFALTNKYFCPLLILYAVMILLSLIWNKRIIKLFMILLDSSFLVIYVIQFFYYRYLMIQSPGEAGWGLCGIFIVLIMLILFVIWVLNDINKFREINDAL